MAILRGLKGRDAGAGARLRAMDAALDARPGWEGLDLAAPVPTLARAVPVDWTDYNGHMTEARYLEAFGAATDRLMALLGRGRGLPRRDGSFFTAETHIRHLAEAHAGDAVRIETRVLAAEGTRMHLWHEMRRGGDLLATAEHMMVHVSLATRRAAAPGEPVAARLAALALAQAGRAPAGGGGTSRGAGAGRCVTFAAEAFRSACRWQIHEADGPLFDGPARSHSHDAPDLRAGHVPDGPGWAGP